MEPEPEPEQLPGSTVLDLVVLVSAGAGVIFLQTGVGTTTNFGTFRGVLKAPIGIVIGFVCQFGLLPFLAYTMCRINGFQGYLAVGLILICSAPGGTMSNAFVMYAYGDTSLSVVMTTLSCFMAFILWPLLTSFYSGLLSGPSEEAVSIPVPEMVGSILAGTVPVPLGALLQRKSPAAGAMLRRIMGPAMVAAIVPAFIAQIIKQPTLLTEFNWPMAIASLVLNHTGFLCGCKPTMTPFNSITRALICAMCRLYRCCVYNILLAPVAVDELASSTDCSVRDCYAKWDISNRSDPCWI